MEKKITYFARILLDRAYICESVRTCTCMCYFSIEALVNEDYCLISAIKTKI